MSPLSMLASSSAWKTAPASVSSTTQEEKTNVGHERTMETHGTTLKNKHCTAAGWKRCEIWVRPEGIEVTRSSSGFICLKYLRTAPEPSNFGRDISFRGGLDHHHHDDHDDHNHYDHHDYDHDYDHDHHHDDHHYDHNDHNNYDHYGCNDCWSISL